MAREKTPYFNPCCCCSLRTGIWAVAIWTILYSLINLSIISWRTAEISYKRERSLGTLKPFGYGDRYKYPGTYNILYRSPEVRWYTAIFAINIIHACVLFFLLCGGVTLIWGFKAGIRWLIWFYVVWCVADIVMCLAYAIAWWTAQVREPDKQVTLPVIQVIFAAINFFCLMCVIAAYRALKKGYLVKKDRTPGFGLREGRQVVVDHSFDYDPFGAVFIDPYREPKHNPPPKYLFNDYESGADLHGRNNSGPRYPLDPQIKKSVETHFNDPAMETPSPLPPKRIPDFNNETMDTVKTAAQPLYNGVGKVEDTFFGRTPTPLPAKEDIPPPSEMGTTTTAKHYDNHFNSLPKHDLPITQPINLEDLRLDYVPSEDSIKPSRPIRGFSQPPAKKENDHEKQKDKRRGKSSENRDDKNKKHKRGHRHHHSRRDERSKTDRDRHRIRDADQSRHRSRSRHSRRDDSGERSRHDRHRSSKSRDRDREKRRHQESSRERGASDRHRQHRRSRSSDHVTHTSKRGRSRRKESTDSSSSSSSSSSLGTQGFVPQVPIRSTSVPFVTRPSSGEDSAFASNLNPVMPRTVANGSGPIVLPYQSDSDSRGPRNVQINSEIQISYPPRPPGTAGTQLPLYTTSVPGPPPNR